MENRHHPRTQCFQLSHDHDLTPIWVFRRATEDGILGLMVDFSAGGVQVLVEKDEDLDAQVYRLFIDGIGGVATPGPGFKVVRKWIGSHQSLYCRCGFEFADPATAAECVQFLIREVMAGTSWIRCELLVEGDDQAPNKS